MSDIDINTGPTIAKDTDNNQSKKSKLSFSSPFGGGLNIESASKLTIFIILIFVFIFVVVFHGFYVYSDKNSWSHGLIDKFSNSKHDDSLAPLQREHEKVKSLIKRWNEISSIDHVTDNTRELNAKTESLLRAYKRFDSRSWKPRLRVSYLYHLAQLQIVHTDVTKEPFEVFLAIENLKTAKQIVLTPELLSTKDDETFEKLKMTSRIDRSLLNAYAFANYFVKTNKLEYKLGESLKVLGGCNYFTDRTVTHELIIEMAGCKGSVNK